MTEVILGDVEVVIVHPEAESRVVVAVPGTPGPPGEQGVAGPAGPGLSEEDRDQLQHEVTVELSESLEPSVDLTILFGNAIA